jgi:hypothetical protein
MIHARQAREAVKNDRQRQLAKAERVLAFFEAGVLRQCENGYSEYTSNMTEMTPEVREIVEGELRECGYAFRVLVEDDLGGMIAVKYLISW